METISIIVPVYNGEACILKTLQSIMNAADKCTEVIVINDGSTDGTDDVIRAFIQENKYESEINYVVQNNCGVSYARNVGIEKSTGSYLIFCDGDDICYARLIQEIRKCINDEPDIVLWGFDAVEKTNGRTISYKVAKGNNADIVSDFLFGKMKIRMGSFAIKKELIISNGVVFDEQYSYAEDLKFIFQSLFLSNRVYIIDGILFGYIKHDGSMIYSYSIKRFDSLRVLKGLRYECDEYFMKNGLLENINYFNNGYYLLHAMYSFESVISHLKSLKEIRDFLGEYYKLYKDVENELRRMKKVKIRLPNEYRKRRIKLFLWSRSIYTYIFFIKNNMNSNIL